MFWHGSLSAVPPSTTTISASTSSTSTGWVRVTFASHKISERAKNVVAALFERLHTDPLSARRSSRKGLQKHPETCTTKECKRAIVATCISALQSGERLATWKQLASKNRQKRKVEKYIDIYIIYNIYIYI